MKHYVGLDVSLEEVSICVADGDGSVIAEGKVATEPSEILAWIDGRVGAVDRIVHESGPLSIWLTRELAGLGAPVVCIDARAAHKALSARMNNGRVPKRWRNWRARAGTGRSTSRAKRATGCAFCSVRASG